jgi:ParB family chromosome partitioning protein
MSDKKRGLGRGFSALIDAGRARAAAEPTPKDSVLHLPIDRIKPNPYQPRHRFNEEALQALAASIRRDGVLQPLAVRKRPEGEGDYELIAGERRLRAARMAGLTEAPCLLIEADEQGLGILSLVENLLREDLNPLDEAEAYQQLIDEFDLTQELIAERVGRSRPHVANTVRLLSLPEMVRVYIASGELSAGHGRALLAIDNDEEKLAVAQEILARGLSVREAESLAKKAALALKRMREGQAPKMPAPHPYAHLAETLQERYMAKVRLTGGKARGVIEIHYFGEEELTRLFETLMGR